MFIILLESLSMKLKTHAGSQTEMVVFIQNKRNQMIMEAETTTAEETMETIIHPLELTSE
jgi:hypothetical protein